LDLYAQTPAHGFRSTNFLRAQISDSGSALSKCRKDPLAARRDSDLHKDRVAVQEVHLVRRLGMTDFIITNLRADKDG
jgi:hypothetical protein